MFELAQGDRGNNMQFFCSGISVVRRTILFWVNGHPMAIAINIVMVIYEVFVVVVVTVFQPHS